MNAGLQRRFPDNGQKVILGNLIDQNGQLNDAAQDKVICSLVNVQEEEIRPAMAGQQGVSRNPPVFLNLTVLFAASFNDYVTGLNLLSAVVGFFQAKKTFTPTNTPAMSELFTKITVDIVNLDPRELSSLWSMIGAKYLPSIIYKFKMVIIDEGRILDEVGLIKEIQGKTS